MKLLLAFVIPFLLSMQVYAGDEEALKFYRSAEQAFERGHYQEAKSWLLKALKEKRSDGRISVGDAEQGCVWQETPRGPRCITSTKVRTERYAPNDLLARVESRLAAQEEEKRTAEAMRLKYANPPALVITGTLTGDGILSAKESSRFILTVENRGKSVAENVAVKPMLPKGIHLDGELNLGQLAPGNIRTIALNMRGDKNLVTGKAKIVFKASERDGFDSVPTPVVIPTQEYFAPALKVIHERIAVSGNRKLTVDYTVVNAGKGDAFNVMAKLDIASTDIFINDENDLSINLGDLKPNQTKNIKFDFFVNNRVKQNEPLPIAVRLLENDPENNISHSLAISMPAVGFSPAVQVASGIIPAAAVATGILNVDVDIPVGKYSREYGIAIAIGNSDYRTISRVEFALNDARTVAEYARKTLGYAKVDEMYNMKSREFRRLFGTARDNYQGQLYKRVLAATHMRQNPPVLIYYSGHGAPSLNKQGGAYLVPTDIENMHYIEDEGYSMKDFYAAISKLPTNDVTVIIDSCFSGSDANGQLIFRDISPAALKTGSSLPDSSLKNAVVMTSASGDEVSNWYREGNHSLFTYHLLAGMRGPADRDKDGVISMDELNKYVSYHVQDYVYSNSITDQTPDVRGDLNKLMVRF